MAGNLCDVCGTGESIGVASSWLGAFSSAYCKRCAEEGAEPYWAILATASMGRLGSFADFVPAFQDTVMATLNVLGKTIDEYWQDVEKEIEKDNEYWRGEYDKALELGEITQEVYDRDRP